MLLEFSAMRSLRTCLLIHLRVGHVSGLKQVQHPPQVSSGKLENGFNARRGDVHTAQKGAGLMQLG